MKFSNSVALLLFALGAAKANNLLVDEGTTYQEFYGVGASWTDSSAWVMEGFRANPGGDPRTLPEAEKDEIYAALFSKDCDGCIGLDILRQPMGTSDFRWGDYTFEDNRGSFSISRDQDYIIPTIRRSLQDNPNVLVMGLPWSAPAWAKPGGSLNGGDLTSDPNVLSDYHDYFVDFVNAYEAAGVPIWAISVQNEPMHSDWSYPTMTLSANALGDLVKGVRGALDAAGRQDIKVVGYDHNWNTPDYVWSMLSDPAVRDAIDAVAFHCYVAPLSDMVLQTNVKNQYPELEIMFTECTESGDLNGFNGDFRWALGNLIISTPRNWASTVIEWNMVLWYNGPKADGGCSNCRGLIDIFDWGYRKNPAFYAFGHLSKFLKPGAVRIDSAQPNGQTKTLAMLNPDGSSFVIILNDSNPDQNYNLQWRGGTCAVSVPSWSAATFFRAAGSNTLDVYRTNDQDSNTRLRFTETVQCTGPPGDTPSPTTGPPTKTPTKSPTNPPTKTPTKAPTQPPTKTPTKTPTAPVSPVPTKAPVVVPTLPPTKTPTKAPVTPTLPPTNAPTKAPAPTSGQGCCTQQFNSCISYCGTTESQCLSCSDHYWLPNGVTDPSCLGRWQGCSQDPSGCCDGLACINNHCTVSTAPPPPTPPPVAPEPTPPPTDAPVTPPPTEAPVAPVAPPTEAPVAPVTPPTEAPVAPVTPPTDAPVTAPTNGQGCCTQQFNTCITYCGTTESECMNCHGVYWLPNGVTDPTCLGRWQGCAQDPSGCCDGLACVNNHCTVA